MCNISKCCIIFLGIVVTYILMVEGAEMVMVPEDGVVEEVGVDGMIQTDMVMVGSLITGQIFFFFTIYVWI